MARFSTSAIVDEASGKVGNVVFSKARNGATIRIRVRPRNPRSAAQALVRAALTLASRAWKALTDDQRAGWRAYAQTIVKHNPTTGKAYHPSGLNVFTELGTKFLQVDPGGSLPTAPPSTPIADDGVTITAAGAAGHITYTASGANGTGITTELLYQALVSPGRVANATKYQHGDFHAFVGGALTHNVNVPAGIYATAYRKVETATGQMTSLVITDTVVVT